MTPPEALKNLGTCPAETADTLLFPFEANKLDPQQVAATVLAEFPRAVVQGVCESGGSSFLLIDSSRVEASPRVARDSKTDLLRKIAEARINLRLARVKVDGMKADLERSKLTLKAIHEGDPADSSFVERVAWGTLHATLVFGVVTEGVKDMATWAATLKGLDRTQAYRVQKYAQMVKLMRGHNLCGRLVTPGFRSYLGDFLMRESFYNGVGLAMVLGIVWAEKAAFSRKKGEIPEEILNDPEFAKALPSFSAEDEKGYLQKLKGMSEEELETEYGRLVDELLALDLTAQPVENELKRVNLEVLAAGHEKLKGVDLSKLNDEQVRVLVAKFQSEQNPKSLLDKLGAGDLAELLGIGLGFGPGTEWARQRLELIPAHRAMEGRRHQIAEMARTDARTELARLQNDGVISRCGGGSGPVGGEAADGSTVSVSVPGIVPVLADDGKEALAPPTEEPAVATRSVVSANRNLSPPPLKVRRGEEGVLQPSVVYPLAQNFHLVPEPLRPHLEAFRSIPGVAFEMVEPAIVANGSGTATLANGGPFFRVFFRTAEELAPPPSSATGGGSAQNPEGLPKLNGFVLPVYIAGNVAAVLVIDHALMKAGIPEQLRGPASFATFYGVNLALYRMGLIERWDLSRAFRGMPLYASGQMLTSIALDQVGIDMGTFWNKAGGIVGGAVPFYLAYKFSQVGTAAESVMGVGMHSMRYAGLAGGAGFLGGLGQALGAAGAITLGNYVGQLLTDGIVHATGIADDPDYHLMQFAYDQMLTDISHRYVVGACGAVMKGMQAVAGYCSDDFEQAVHEGLDMKINDLVEASDQMGDQVDDVLLSFGLQDIMEGRAVDLDAIEERMHQFFSENGEGIKNAYALLALTGQRAHRGQRIKEMFDDDGTFRNRAAVKSHLLALVDAQIKSRERESHRLARERALMRKEGDLTLLADADHLTLAQERFYTQGRGAQLALELLYLNTLRSQLG